ncbi:MULTISPECIES: STAS domain-containing protein [unclassified Blastococcus]|uniref:STAS domain-containing protein n=1 Tax=unclassified Blastococcus TaxID=2619396 RepID=UPI001EF13996|nr:MULTISPECIES: STAS domain-containing protein [unclassified Blastococcus]
MSVQSLFQPVIAGERVARQLTLSIDLSVGQITLAGELDRWTAHHLLDAARALSATPHQQWVMVVADLQFCDATGLRAISACYRTALRRGSRMKLLGAAPGMRKALASLRLDSHVMDDFGPVIDCSAEEQRTYPLVRRVHSPLLID